MGEPRVLDSVGISRSQDMVAHSVRPQESNRPSQPRRDAAVPACSLDIDSTIGPGVSGPALLIPKTTGDPAGHGATWPFYLVLQTAATFRRPRGIRADSSCPPDDGDISRPQGIRADSACPLNIGEPSGPWGNTANPVRLQNIGGYGRQHGIRSASACPPDSNGTLATRLHQQATGHHC